MKNIVKFFLMVALVLPALPVMSAVPAEHDVEKLMRASGTWQQIEQVPALIISGFEQARTQGAPMSDADLAIMVKAAEQAYLAEHFLNKIRRALRDSMTAEEVREMLTWYESDLGKRVSQAEMNATTVDAMTEMMANAEALLENKDLVALSARLDALLNWTQMVVTIQEFQSEAVYTAVFSAIAPGRPINIEEYRARLASERGSLEEQTRQLLALSSAYTYRDIDLDSMAEYERALATPSARKFNQVMVQAIVDGYKETTRHFAAEVGRELAAAKQRR